MDEKQSGRTYPPDYVRPTDGWPWSRIGTLETALNEAAQERDKARAEVERLQDALADARRVIQYVQWDEDNTCPWCDNDKPIHAEDCPRQIFLRDNPEVK